MPRAKRQPLRAVKNGAPAKEADEPSEPVELLPVLERAINAMSHDRLKTWVKQYCKSIEPLRQELEKDFLVTGREIVRYHADTDSEDNQNSGIESNKDEEDEDHNGSDSEGNKSLRRKLKPILAADNEKVAKYHTCLNCKTESDITSNEREDCRWHPGKKEVYNDDDFWADHDEDCHGYIDDLVDEPDYADGFKWSCCDGLGDDEGCKSTKHKAKANEIRYLPAAIVSVPGPASRKRKAERQ